MIPLPLLALAVASFGIGTTEFVVMGLLPDVAGDLGVSIPRAGLLVSGYALGVAVGSPLVALATAGLPRKTALLGLMTVFVLGNLGCALAPGYAGLMTARVVTSLAHGSFFGIGSVVAAELMPQRRAGAVAIMFTGLTLANVLGVPFGTLLGQAAGWRATFWAVAGLGVAAFLLLAALLPRGLAGSGAGLAREVRALGHRQVVLAMATSTLASVSLFSVFTYITPLLETVTGFTPHAVSGALLLFGGGLTAGNLLGGRLADWRLMPAVIGAFALLAVTLAVFSLSSRAAVPALATMAAWGVLAFALVAPLQIWVMDSAAGAPNLASIVNQGAFNLGNATGAWLGGIAIGAGLGYEALPLLGALVAVAALLLALASARDGVRSAARA